MSKLAIACPDISEVCRLVRRSVIHLEYLHFRVPISFSLKINMFGGLVGEMTRWLPDFRHELVVCTWCANWAYLECDLTLCVFTIPSYEWLWADSIKQCGSLGRSNSVGRLDRRGVKRLFFRIQHSYSATISSKVWLMKIDISESTRNVSDSFPVNVQMNNPQAHHVWPWLRWEC